MQLISPGLIEFAATQLPFGRLEPNSGNWQAIEFGKTVPPKRPAHYLWAVLIARVYEAFPLLCPNGGGQMRLIAFITQTADIPQILDHIRVSSQPPHISPARGPPLWEGCMPVVADSPLGTVNFGSQKGHLVLPFDEPYAMNSNRLHYAQ